jgi:hypothetical protein
MLFVKLNSFQSFTFDVECGQRLLRAVAMRPLLKHRQPLPPLVVSLVGSGAVHFIVLALGSQRRQPLDEALLDQLAERARNLAVRRKDRVLIGRTQLPLAAHNGEHAQTDATHFQASVQEEFAHEEFDQLFAARVVTHTGRHMYGSGDKDDKLN